RYVSPFDFLGWIRRAQTSRHGEATGGRQLPNGLPGADTWEKGEKRIRRSSIAVRCGSGTFSSSRSEGGRTVVNTLSSGNEVQQPNEGRDIPPGTVVGDYEVIGPLGAGGMGRVYRVRHLLSKRIEAMKLVLPDIERSGMIERFHREIEVQARLKHPNICALHTAVRIGSSLALIMEFAEGAPLTEELKSGPLQPGRA